MNPSQWVTESEFHAAVGILDRQLDDPYPEKAPVDEIFAANLRVECEYVVYLYFRQRRILMTLSINELKELGR